MLCLSGERFLQLALWLGEFSLPHKEVTGPGLPLQGLEAGIIPKQETVLEFLRACWGGCAVPPSAKIGTNSECRHIAWWESHV